MSSASISLYCTVVLLVGLQLLSSCHGLSITQVTGCPRNDAYYTYDCEGGMPVTVNSQDASFKSWTNPWSIDVDQRPCTNNTILTDYSVSCIPPNMSDSGQCTHNLNLNLRLFTCSNQPYELSSTNV